MTLSGKSPSSPFEERGGAVCPPLNLMAVMLLHRNAARIRPLTPGNESVPDFFGLLRMPNNSCRFVLHIRGNPYHNMLCYD
ncbi:MAG: hypothetical protein DRI57_23045 [Deltaproteobacteria bacterium]|nr:MAG: hypothetical protein DRI57_23045 [Deltaproteobacteria bacterium]